MKIFHKGYRMNFVDNNNVFVGWDDSTDCCERHDWELEPSNLTPEELEDYNWDPEFFEEGHAGDECESGGFVRFRATNSVGEELFLTLSNYHNGYYSHGFTMHGGQGVIHYGSL